VCRKKPILPSHPIDLSSWASGIRWKSWTQRRSPLQSLPIRALANFSFTRREERVGGHPGEECPRPLLFKSAHTQAARGPDGPQAEPGQSERVAGRP
jgi:hypothetical protein